MHPQLAPAIASCCADGSIPDNVSRAGRNGNCLIMQYSKPQAATANSPLIVFLHGNSEDGEVNLTKASINLLDWLKAIGEQNAAPTIFLQRPGFRSVLGKSDGFENQPPSTCNRLSVQHLAYVADAMASLRDAYPQQAILLVGHSGGALLAIEIAAHYPQFVDALVLSACPCDLRAIRQLPPDEPLLLDPFCDYRLIPDTLPIIALAGDRDTTTPAAWSRRFIELVRSKGARNARFVLAPGHDHSTIRPYSTELPAAIAEQVQLLQQVTRKTQ